MQNGEESLNGGLVRGRRCFFKAHLLSWIHCMRRMMTPFSRALGREAFLWGLAAILLADRPILAQTKIQWVYPASGGTVPLGVRLLNWHHEAKGHPNPELMARLLRVYVMERSIDPSIDPPIIGSYLFDEKGILFTPRFPFSERIGYLAIHESMTSTWIPDEKESNPTQVNQIDPQAEVLPENLLKFYIHFSAPMSGGAIYKHLRLFNLSDRCEVQWPFLELGEALWNPEMTRLTLFMDPGRIKTGVKPLIEVGPSLEAGKAYILEVSQKWKDATGNPLSEPFRKTFTVGPSERNPINPKSWNILPPKPGTTQSLQVSMNKPMDAALAMRMIGVIHDGQPLEGTPWLNDETTIWRFEPAAPWKEGTYGLRVESLIEDLAGNNIGKTFEVDIQETIQRRIVNASVIIPFSIQPKTP